MKTLIVIAHPQLENSTTQQFFKEGLAGFNNFDWHVLKNEYKIAEERQMLIDADRIIFQFPMYWYSAPAILKQWIDDVFSMNQLNLSGKELGIVVSTGDPAKDFQAGGLEKYTISELLRPFEMLANKMDMQYLTPITVFQFAYMKEIDRQLLLIQYQQYVTNRDFQKFDSQIEWFVAGLGKRIGDKPELAQLLMILQENEDQRKDLSWNVDMFKQDED